MKDAELVDPLLKEGKTLFPNQLREGEAALIYELSMYCICPNLPYLGLDLRRIEGKPEDFSPLLFFYYLCSASYSDPFSPPGILCFSFGLDFLCTLAVVFSCVPVHLNALHHIFFLLPRMPYLHKDRKKIPYYTMEAIS